jgi:hypothetical protein
MCAGTYALAMAAADIKIVRISFMVVSVAPLCSLLVVEYLMVFLRYTFKDLFLNYLLTLFYVGVKV